MKQTRTTLKELTAAYRAVLRHGILCNAIALGLIAATPAMAETVATVNNVEYETLKDAVTGNATSGSTINLLTSVNQGAGISMPTNSNLVLDLGGNTYTGYTDPAGSTGTKRQVFQAQGGDITIQNGTIDIADTPDGEFRMVIQNYSNLTLDNVVLDGSNANSAATPYALSNNNGTIHIKDSEIIGKEGGYAFDVYSWKQLGTSAANTYGDVSVTVDNSRIVGKIEVDTDGSLIGDTKHELTINGGELVAVTGGSKITTNGTTTLNGVTMSGNSATNGAAVHNTQKAATKGGEGISGRGILNITDSTFSGNTAATNGGAIYNEATLTATGAVFGDESGNILLKNVAENGGAIYNTGNLTVDGGAFYNNTANANTAETSGGGAIYNLGTLTTNSDFIGNSTLNTDTGRGGAIWNKGNLTITGGTYASNTSGVRGGAINISDGTVSIENATFGGDTSAMGNTASNGGAIAMNKGTVEISDVTLKNNYASANGGAIYDNKGNLNITGSIIEQNVAGNIGGAIYNKTQNVTLTNSILRGNSAKFAGAIYNDSGSVILTDTIIDNNVVSADLDNKGGSGGAIYNKSGTIMLTGGALRGNSAKTAGAIYNESGSITLTDTIVQDNYAYSIVGAVLNKSGVITINAKDIDVTFSGNTHSNDVTTNDLYNDYGTVNLNAATGRTLSLEGGIGGGLYDESEPHDLITQGTININADASDTGTVKIANYLNGQNVNVAHGELHFATIDTYNNVALIDTNINVASGATMNTIDNLINNYVGHITLADGALVAGDIDYVNGLADTYSADNGATITYTLANALNLTGIQYGVSKEIRVTNEGATVDKDAGFGWFDSDHGLTLESGGAGTGTILVAGTSGGINAAVDATNETAQEMEYILTAATETFDGADNVIQNANMTVTGNGNETTSNTIVFANDMIVDGSSTLSMQDINLDNTDDEAITVQQGGTMYLTDARVGVDLNILGTLVSDPTYYDARVVNSGTSSFTGDVFENGSSLTNSATVNLNNVEFVAGSTLTGLAGNVLNVAGTGNIFNGTSTGNNVVLAAGADYTGTLSNGSVDARNGGIDTFSGAVSGGDLYVDADLNATTDKIDSFTSATGATIKGISLASSGYGTGNEVTLALDGATFDDDVVIDGFNYYTQVTNNGGTLVFSDKLLNESGFYDRLAWNTGHYIKQSATLDHAGDNTTYMTVGQALTALDSQLETVSTAGAIADGDTGFVTGDAVYDTLANYSTTGEMDTAISTALNNAVADGGVVDTAIDSAITAAVGTGGAVTNAISGALNTAVADGGVVDSAIDSAITAAVGTGGAVTNAISGALNTAVGDGGVVDSAIDSAIAAAVGTGGAVDSAIDDKITTSLADGGAINTAINGAVTAANTYTDGAIASALTQVTNGVTAVYDQAHEWAESLLGVDVDSNVNNQLQTALSDLATADSTTNSIESTTIAGALHELDTDVAAIDDRLDTAEGTLTTHNTALATLNGDESTNGSVAKTVKDNAQNATYTNSGGSTSLASASTVGGALNLLGSATDANINAIALLNGDESTEGSVAYAAANAVAAANAYTDSKLAETRDSAVAASNAYTDRRIEDLDKNLSAGVAGAVALSSVAVSGVERGEVSVGAGYGYFNGQSAAAFGATMGLSNRWSINAGAGISNADVSFRAGTNYKFKLF